MNKPIRIDILGLYPASEGYSNNRFFLEQLESSEEIQLDQRSSQALMDTNLFESSQSGLLRKTLVSLKMSLAAVYGVCRSIYRRRTIDAVYVPYPSILCLLLFSLVPRALRPPIFADGFISLYDTAVTDRKLFEPQSLKAKLLYYLERRSISTCSRFICDTHCNADYYSKLFELPRQLFAVLPLAINEGCFQAVVPPHEREHSLNVLFFGSFSPLHGVDVIAGSAKILSHNRHIHFTLIGKGQVASACEALLSELPNVSWLNTWMSNEALAEQIARSDVVLGVFGSSSKARRVIPFKIYTALCSRRAVVSGETECSELGDAGVLILEENTPEKLAQSLLKLRDEAGLRDDLAERGHAYFQKHLGYPNRCQGLVRLIADTTSGR